MGTGSLFHATPPPTHHFSPFSLFRRLLVFCPSCNKIHDTHLFVETRNHCSGRSDLVPFFASQFGKCRFFHFCSDPTVEFQLHTYSGVIVSFRLVWKNVGPTRSGTLFRILDFGWPNCAFLWIVLLIFYMRKQAFPPTVRPISEDEN